MPTFGECQEERASEVSSHEIGHSVGLNHCAVSDCLMQRSSSGLSYASGKLALRAFCDHCALDLTQALQHETDLQATKAMTVV